MTSIDTTLVKNVPLRSRAGRTRFALLLTLSSVVGAGTEAFAEMDGVVAGSAAAVKLTPTDSSTRYSLPWQLRPVTIGNGVGIESAAAAFNDPNGNLDAAVATVLSASYRISEEWTPMIRLAFVGNDAPGAAVDGSSFANPVVGVTYSRKLGSYRLALFGATTIPVGTGGGDNPNLRAARTNTASMTARPADSAMFQVNYLTEIAGVDFAYVNHGLTAQAEATLQQSVRVRGSHSADATDLFRTNAAVGLHVGTFIGSHVSVGSDLRYQRWLSHPTGVDRATGMHTPYSEAEMDTATAAIGVRLHFRLGQRAWIRPGISYARGLDARGLDAPLITAQTNAAQVDIPVTF